MVADLPQNGANRANAVRANEVAEPSRVGHLRRVTAFDGLRGLAALVVVFHHALLASIGVLAATYQSAANRPPTGSLAWWWSETPLHIFWAGQEAVIVFFVLSGYVLAIPALKRGTKWFDASYYPRRFVRLYLPVWAALVVAAALHLAYARQSVPGATWWLNEHPSTLSASAGIKAATLVSASAGQFTSVLWSLKWEVLFSALLPLVLLLPILTRRHPLLALLGAAGCLGLTGIGAQLDVPTARYMPIFVLGAVLAFHMDRLRVNVVEWARVAFTGAAVIVSVSLLTMSYWTQNRGSSSASGVPMLGVVLGACLALWLAVNSPIALRFFESRPAQWAGSRSFSLYLVHEPIVVAVAFAFGGNPTVGVFLLIVVPVCLLAAELFWRVVESPSIRSARWVGHRSFELLNKRDGAARSS